MKNVKILLLFPLLAGAVLAYWLLPGQKTISFAVIGDMPYFANKAKDENTMMTGPDGVIYKAIRNLNPPVLIHLGDLKDGETSCTDDFLRKRRDQIAALLPGKIIYTPGDNDWTDCDRPENSTPFDELNRKDFLFKIFYQEKEGELMYRNIEGLMRQKAAKENTAWRIGGLQFAVIHVVGTNNGRKEILKTSPVSKALDYADLRDQNNAAWLKQIFQQAHNAQGVVIALQEDIYRLNPDYPGVDCTPQNRQKCDGLKWTRDLIERLAKAYQKPVLVVHGSTSPCCFEQPRSDLPNLWRFNSFGDFEYSDAALVTFDAGADRPFAVKGLLEDREIPSSCR